MLMNSKTMLRDISVSTHGSRVLVSYINALDKTNKLHTEWALLLFSSYFEEGMECSLPKILLASLKAVQVIDKNRWHGE